MISKKKGVIVLSIVTILSFISIVWVSCSKPEKNPKSCAGVICANGGYCDTGVCVCPTGYEGPRCATAVVTKFIGTWDVNQKVIGSDSANIIGDSTSYIAFLKKTATPTTFFIDNFYGDASYNNIICTVNKDTSTKFTVDTLTAFHMLYDNFRVLQWSGGDIHDNNTLITTIVRIRRVNASVNWQVDTLFLSMRPHAF
jgi:hypothetical protein